MYAVNHTLIGQYATYVRCQSKSTRKTFSLICDFREKVMIANCEWCMYVEGLDSNGKIKTVFSLFVMVICENATYVRCQSTWTTNVMVIGARVAFGRVFPLGVCLFNYARLASFIMRSCPARWPGSPFRPFLTPSADKVNTYLRPLVVITSWSNISAHGRRTRMILGSMERLW